MKVPLLQEISDLAAGCARVFLDPTTPYEVRVRLRDGRRFRKRVKDAMTARAWGAYLQRHTQKYGIRVDHVDPWGEPVLDVELWAVPEEAQHTPS